jgi:hypothetical protein
MNIDTILNEMDIVLEEAFSVPLLGKRVVDAEALGTLIARMRQSLPEEIMEARRIVRDVKKIEAEARKNEEKILAAAQARAEKMVSEQEIVKRSKETAEQIELTAKQRAKTMTDSSFRLTEEILTQTEQQLTRSAADIKRRLVSMRQKRKRG